MKDSELQRVFADATVDDPNYRGEEDTPRQRQVQNVLSAFSPGKRILDVGSADGAVLSSFSSTHSLVAADISEKLLAKAAARGYTQTVQVDAFSEALPFPDKSFDVVVCGECIEHGADTDWLLSQINRVLKPNGDLVLTFPNIRTPISFLLMLCNRAPMMAARYRSGHVRDFTTSSIKLALHSHKFQILTMKGGSFAVGRDASGILPGLASVLPSWASTVVVHAKKRAESAYSVANHLTPL